MPPPRFLQCRSAADIEFLNSCMAKIRAFSTSPLVEARVQGMCVHVLEQRSAGWRTASGLPVTAGRPRVTAGDEEKGPLPSRLPVSRRGGGSSGPAELWEHTWARTGSDVETILGHLALHPMPLAEEGEEEDAAEAAVAPAGA